MHKLLLWCHYDEIIISVNDHAELMTMILLIFQWINNQVIKYSSVRVIRNKFIIVALYNVILRCIIIIIITAYSGFQE